VKDIVVLAGPNGAGKTTAASVLLPHELEILEFVNADEIARGLSPYNAEGASVAAARLMIARMRELVRLDISFAFETTCAGRAHANLLKHCRKAGWRLTLLYLWLPTPEDALTRVARRVGEGGHAIPDDVVVRRYWAGLRNMRDLYLPLAEVAAIYDNSDNGRIMIAERTPDADLIVHDSARWAAIVRATP
jgi:predicted ABC-type ATPase